ncbi:MAG TPA: hypothetical protein VJI32_01100 [Candidatus Nanoarchaeia archaeon]|nr:hypothetical protein [Candidatus Nanoarchaeia archaeon]
MVDTFFETTVEKDLIINARELKYKGIFQPDTLFTTINKALKERGFTLREKKTEEQVTETGRKTYVELRPFKSKTNYLALILKIRINLDKVQEVVETVDDAKIRMHQGDITIYFDAWVLTNWNLRWNMSPLTFFLKGFINKFLYIFPLEEGAKGELVGDTAYVYAQVKKFLMSYQPQEGKQVREEDIREQVEAEMEKEMKENTQ